jgi:hypothetical protein
LYFGGLAGSNLFIFALLKSFAIFAANIQTMTDAVKMIEFCRMTGLPAWKLTRRIDEFDTLEVDGWHKPFIKITERNLNLARLHANSRLGKPKLPRYTPEVYAEKYNIPMDRLKKWYRSLVKDTINGREFIIDTSTNRRLATGQRKVK